MLLCLPLLGLWLGPVCKLPLIVFFGLPVLFLWLAHATMLSFSLLPWAGLSARLLFFSPFFVPVLSFAFLCLPCFFFFFFPLCCVCFPFFFSPSGWTVFVLPCGWYFGFSVALSWVGASARPVCFPWVGALARPVCFALFCCVISLCWGFGSPRVFALFCCVISLCWGFGSPCVFALFCCVISLCWGFGSPRVFALFCCVISLCWGFGSPCVFALFCCVISLCWGFGSPRVFALFCCVISLCWGFGCVRLRLAASTWCWASPRPCHASFCLLASSGWVFCLGLFVVMDFLSGVDGSDSESSADELERVPGYSGCSCSVRWRGSGSIPMGSLVGNYSVLFRCWYCQLVCNTDPRGWQSCAVRGLWDWFLSRLAWCTICCRTWADMQTLNTRRQLGWHCNPQGYSRSLFWCTTRFCRVGDCWEWYTEFGRCASGQS